MLKVELAGRTIPFVLRWAHLNAIGRGNLSSSSLSWHQVDRKVIGFKHEHFSCLCTKLIVGEFLSHELKEEEKKEVRHPD